MEIMILITWFVGLTTFALSFGCILSRHIIASLVLSGVGLGSWIFPISMFLLRYQQVANGRIKVDALKYETGLIIVATQFTVCVVAFVVILIIAKRRMHNEKE